MNDHGRDLTWAQLRTFGEVYFVSGNVRFPTTTYDLNDMRQEIV